MNRVKMGLRRIALRVSAVIVVLGLLATTSVNVLAVVPPIISSLSPSSGAPGVSVTVTGSGFGVSEPNLIITFNSANIVTGITATPTGTLSRAFTVPPNTPAGTYPVTVTGSGNGPTLASNFNVTAKISLSPFSGTTGSSVLMNGSGFGASETGISVIFDSTPLVSNISANPSGSWSTNVTIPAAAFGLHTFNASGSITAPVGTISYTVMPAITINKTSGAPGTSVTVNGTGFGVSEAGIAITLDGNPVTSNLAANASGSWTGNITIPAASAGAHIIGAYGSSTAASLITGVNFLIGAAVSINKTSGAPGTAVTVTGAGFGVSETGIAITLDGNPIVSNISANASGSWTANITIPAASSGSHVIGAAGSTTTTAGTLSFTVTPVITLNKASGAPGSAVTVTGAGFGASETGITVTFDNNPVSSNIAANASGSWTANVTVPTGAAGPHMFGSYGANTATGAVVNVTFTISTSISISKTSGAPGSPITMSGTGFAANEMGITITFDNNPVVSNLSANANGAWTSNTTVPAASSGSHTFGAYGATTTTAGTVSFTITPVISLSKTSGAPGNSITVTGAGFGASETGITITFDNNPATSNISANASGAWSATLTVPVTSAGAHTVGAAGSSTLASAVTGVNFTLGASVSLSKTSGTVGNSITVTGVGFVASENGIAVTFDNNPVASNIVANTSGGWTATITIPVASSGSHMVGAAGSATQSSSVTGAGFSIGPSIALNKTNGAPGTPISVTGAGFGASETGINVTFDGNPVASNIVANASGSWSANVTIPAATLGAHAIGASSLSTTLGAGNQATFTIAASATILPTTGKVGDSVRITGSGFAPSSPLLITYDDAILLSAATDANGSINQSVVIPVSKAGNHSIGVADSQGNSIKTTFAIGNTPPPAPTGTSPGNNSTIGVIGGATPTFAWTSVAEANSVVYELQISTTSDFSALVLDKTKLQSTQYTLDPSEALPGGHYYWRVKAIDKASNESAWSDARGLKSGFMTTPILILLIALGLVLVFLLIYALTRRSRPEAITVSEYEAPRYAPSPGQWQSLEYGEGGDFSRERPAPQRLALPEFSRTSRTAPTEEQSRLKIIMEFAEALPLPEVDYDAKCLVDLVESQLQTELSPPVAEQLLRGEIRLRYEPTWMRHPIYKDMTALLQRQPSLQKLSVFISDVEHCATSAMGLIQQIYQEASAELPSDFLARGGWQYLIAVYTDAVSWYAGRSLRDPLEKDYVLETDRGGPQTWLAGDYTSLFPGHMILAADEPEALRLRALHLKMRRNCRSSEKARQVTSAITHLKQQREELIDLFKIDRRS